MVTLKEKQNLVRDVAKQETIRQKAEAEAQKAIDKWKKENKRFIKYSIEHAALKRRNTQKAKKLKSFIDGWEKYSDEITEKRDEARKRAKEATDKIADIKHEQGKLLQKEVAEITAADEVVRQVLVLKQAERAAIESTNTYLNNQVFTHLIDPNTGNIKSQVSFVSKDGQFRVVAMVNTITHVDASASQEAKSLIDNFFGVKAENVKDDSIKIWYDLTQQILVEKTRFKVGSKLYQFLSLEIDPVAFPELKKAQLLLRGGLRSEKSSSYIRIYKRRAGTTKWDPWNPLVS